MTKATIPLAKSFDKHAEIVADNCGLLSEKIDGVPILFRMAGSAIIATTRQGKPVGASIDHILLDIKSWLPDNWACVAEVFLPGAPFKDSSGAVRRDEANTQLVYAVFDGWPIGGNDAGFEARYLTMYRFFSQAKFNIIGRPRPKHGFIVQQHRVGSGIEMDYAKKQIKDTSPTPPAFFEGFVLRDPNGPSIAGSRSNGYWRITDDPTADLPVIGFDEAFSKDGKPLDMVGAVLVERKGKIEKVGPGKLTHAERKAIWADFVSGVDVWPLAKVKFKRDPSYDKMRQPTFQAWREDKDTPSED